MGRYQGNEAIRKLTEAVQDELIQPVMIIAGYVHLLKEFAKDDEMHRLYLSNISSKLKELNELKNKVEAISQKVAPKKGSSPD
jgi:signal transduction histidine kinase